jgi:hypothetical protein
MIDNEYIERRPDDLEVYRRLDAFAQVRLAPDPAAMARIRSALMGQAVTMADARAASLALQAAPAVAVPERPSIALRRPQVSRWSAAFLAACLTLGLAAGSVAASAAGGPLYGPRLWLEEANLPHAALPRANAQLDRLDARIQEIQTATASGNVGAVEAALAAYGEIVSDLEDQARADARLGASLTDDLARRQIVLLALLDEVPPQALDALEHALQQGANAVEVMGAEEGNPGDPVRNGGGGSGTNQGGSGSQGGSSSGASGGSGSGSGASGGSGSGQGTQGGTGNDGNPPRQDPGRSPKPERPPKPEATPKKPAAEPTTAAPTPASNPGGEREQGGESSRQDQSGGNEGDAD